MVNFDVTIKYDDQAGMFWAFSQEIGIGTEAKSVKDLERSFTKLAPEYVYENTSVARGDAYALNFVQDVQAQYNG